jgi:hypothetical protein
VVKVVGQWLSLPQVAELFGVSQESLKRIAISRGFPLRRATPHAMPGVLESELFSWLKTQPATGMAVRSQKRKPKKKSR